MSEPLLCYIARCTWRLMQNFTVLGITIPAGYEFDLASIPRILWPILAPFELSVAAPLLHDYLYSGEGPKGITRKDADLMFLEVMKLEGIGLVKRRAAYLAVRAAGWAAYKGE